VIFLKDQILVASDRRSRDRKIAKHIERLSAHLLEFDPTLERARKVTLGVLPGHNFSRKGEVALNTTVWMLFEC
jgi:hypothetical protein